MPTYPQPNISDPNWGGPLNAHMATLSDGAGGGINTATSSTTTDGQTVAATADEGYTYVANNKMMKTIGGVDTVILDGTDTNTWTRNINGDGITPLGVSTDLVHIMDDGRVGVGSDAPAAHLHIEKPVGGTSFSAAFKVASGVNNVGIFTGDQSNSQLIIGNSLQQWNVVNKGVDGSFQLQDTTAGGSVPITVIAGSGLVGIGEPNPTAKLDVNGFVKVDTSYVLREGATGTTVAQFRELGGGLQGMKFTNGPNNQEYMRIDGSTGNVGIGTTAPNSKLSVVGLPTSAAGLAPGDIWIDVAAGNALKIV